MSEKSWLGDFVDLDLDLVLDLDLEGTRGCGGVTGGRVVLENVFLDSVIGL